MYLLQRSKCCAYEAFSSLSNDCLKTFAANSQNNHILIVVVLLSITVLPS